MAFSVERGANIGWRILGFCFVIIAIAAQPAVVMAANAGPSDTQSTLRESLADIWTGKEFSPELTQRQQALKSVLKAGALTRNDLQSAMEKIFLSLLDSQETSRYILKTFPERINALFSPYLEWKDVKEIIWRAVSSPAAGKDPVIINLGTLAPSGTPWLSVPEAVFFPEIKRLSGDKVQIKIYAGGVMGEDTDILRKMDIGQLDACGCTSLGVWGACPDTSALLIPGLFNNYDEIDYICEKFRKRLDNAFEEKGYILAALIDTGFFYLFSKNKVTGLADLRNRKPLMWFPAIETKLYKELGINATPVAVPEIVSALSTGMADTNLAPAAWMLGMQAYQYSNYYLTPPIFYSPGAVIVSTHIRKRVEKQLGISPTFSHNFTEVFVYELNSIEPEWRVQLRSYEKKCLQAFETKCGIKAMTFSPADQETLKKAGRAVQEQLAGETSSKDLMNDMLKALEEYRASHR